MTRKTDNSRLDVKLELRRHFLRKYHADGTAKVFDCCQGAGIIWRTLQSEFKLERYWGVDVKKQTGRLQLNSVRILDQPGWNEDVIDVDTYGAPWKHYEALLKHLDHPATVFLTVGLVRVGGGSELPSFCVRALGMDRALARRLPGGLRPKCLTLSTDRCLTYTSGYGIVIEELVEGLPAGRNARYFGARLAPSNGPA